MLAQHSPIEAEVEEQLTFIQFTVAGSKFILPMNEVQEVTEFMAPKSYPLKVPGHLGVINLRGNVIPVVSMVRFLTHSEREEISLLRPEENRVLILNCENSHQIAILASQVKKISLPLSLFPSGVPVAPQTTLTIQGVPVQRLSSESFVPKTGGDSC